DAVRPHAGNSAPVRIEIALAVAPDAARHAGPRPPADELADLAAYGSALLVDDVHVLPERGKAKRDRLDRLRDHGREEARADLGTAADVHDRRPRPADVLEEPAIRVGVPRLTGRAERPERREVCARLSLRDERADERGREAEHRHPLRLDEAPE